jgi:uncharacterized membrane protein YfcA
VTAGRWRGVAAGAVAGLAGGLFGVGGGIILVPALTGLFHLTQHQAHGTSLAVIAATALPAVVIYALRGQVDVWTAVLVGLGSLLTARYGARAARRFSGPTLKRIFAVFLVVVALRLFWKVPIPEGHPGIHGVTGAAFDLAVGAAVGLLAGFMGVGGGVIAVPAFTLGLGMSQHVAQGTSLAVILVTGPAGALEHARHGNVVARAVPWLAAGAAMGALAASLWAGSLRHDALVRAFAVFLMINAVHTWIRARPRPPVGLTS